MTKKAGCKLPWTKFDVEGLPLCDNMTMLKHYNRMHLRILFHESNHLSNTSKWIGVRCVRHILFWWRNMQVWISLLRAWQPLVITILWDPLQFPRNLKQAEPPMGHLHLQPLSSVRPLFYPHHCGRATAQVASEGCVVIPVGFPSRNLTCLAAIHCALWFSPAQDHN